MVVRKRSTTTRSTAARGKKVTAKRASSKSRTGTARPRKAAAPRPAGPAAKVLVNGRLQSSTATGQAASEFGRGSCQYVVVNGGRSDAVEPSYALREGDTLVVTQKGVGG